MWSSGARAAVSGLGSRYFLTRPLGLVHFRRMREMEHRSEGASDEGTIW
jgi:hypothetical protein